VDALFEQRVADAATCVVGSPRGESAQTYASRVLTRK
jgi:hypothetical protein